jgi:predicted lipoprotein
MLDRARLVRALSALTLGAATIATVVFAGACERVTAFTITGSAGAGDTPSGPSNVAATGPGAVSRSMVLGGVATCALSLYGDAAAAAAELDVASAALASSPTPENEAAARAAWSKTIGLWQQAELLKIGPAGPTTLPAGEGLRDYVYSWPLVSRCLVEQAIVSRAYAKETWSETALVNTRGLAAAEYLLFYGGTDNGCSSSASINSQGTWAALGGDLAVRKREYVAVVAKDVAQRTAAIHAAWDTDQGFAAGLARSGASGAPFSSDQDALNAVSDGLFYLENEVKDLKLGRPLGKTEDCTTPSCPDAVESQFARAARDHIKNNLIGFQRVFDGCDEAADTGFDDLLRSAGAGDLADQMNADIGGAIAAADALSSADLVVLVDSERASVEALHAAVKRLSDELKTDFATILDLELPKAVEGDND